MSVAARVAAAKRKHPEQFCIASRCLWRTRRVSDVTPCPKHPRNPLPSNACYCARFGGAPHPRDESECAS